MSDTTTTCTLRDIDAAVLLRLLVETERVKATPPLPAVRELARQRVQQRREQEHGPRWTPRRWFAPAARVVQAVRALDRLQRRGLVAVLRPYGCKVGHVALTVEGERIARTLADGAGEEAHDQGDRAGGGAG